MVRWDEQRGLTRTRIEDSARASQRAWAAARCRRLVTGRPWVCSHCSAQTASPRRSSNVTTKEACISRCRIPEERGGTQCRALGQRKATVYSKVTRLRGRRRRHIAVRPSLSLKPMQRRAGSALPQQQRPVAPADGKRHVKREAQRGGAPRGGAFEIRTQIRGGRSRRRAGLGVAGAGAGRAGWLLSCGGGSKANDTKQLRSIMDVARSSMSYNPFHDAANDNAQRTTAQQQTALKGQRTSNCIQGGCAVRSAAAQLDERHRRSSSQSRC